MATTYLGNLNGAATGDTLSAANWNKATDSLDRVAMLWPKLFTGGIKTGWTMESGATTVISGTGHVGPCWCVTTTSQAISNLTSGTNYVFAKTDAGSAASGTVDFVARTTSASITNYDGVTSALILGSVVYNSTTGIKSITTTPRDTWYIDHGALLTGLSDNDHPQYMRDLSTDLLGANAIIPAASAASTSAYGTTFKTTAVKYPALSSTKAGFDFYCPPDYSGTITVTLDFASSGLGGNSHWDLLARSIASAAAWDAAPASCCASKVVAIGGTNGHLRRTSMAWTTALPAKNERCTLVVRRNGANASDVMSGAARLLSARVLFNTAI